MMNLKHVDTFPQDGPNPGMKVYEASGTRSCGHFEVTTMWGEEDIAARAASIAASRCKVCLYASSHVSGKVDGIYRKLTWAEFAEILLKMNPNALAMLETSEDLDDATGWHTVHPNAYWSAMGSLKKALADAVKTTTQEVAR